MMNISLSAVMAAAALTACGGSQPTAPAVPASANAAVKPSYNGNIYWNKHGVQLRYQSNSHGRAELSYFGPDGYYTEPIYCKHGGQISATTHRQWGNPKEYLHVEYWFQAQSSGPDVCSFTAILNNTGSPPIAILNLHIRK
ncbi:MAG TPA: hypothetical protein VGI19_02605 [Candidatus Cybelea sp.]